MNFQQEIDEIKKIRQAKFSSSNNNIKKEITYDYNVRKDILDYIKKCSKSDLIKERMDKNEKQEYKNKISKLFPEDLEYFSDSDLNTNFMIDLFRFNFNFTVLEKAYGKYLSFPHINMIKELITKPKLPENFLLKLVTYYLQTNKNYINLILSINIFDTKYTLVIDYIMDLFYSDLSVTVTYEQLKLIYSKTNITPDKLKFLIKRCSNISGYSKCSKTWVEKPNRDLIKILIHEIELKYKCKIDIDLYNV